MNDEVDLIDYRELVERYSFGEHARRADQYFASLTMEAAIARKPFADPAEAAELCAGVSALLSGLRLFPGARVLDFGAGLCWFSKILALLGCEVTAADVSVQALSLGRKIIEGDAIGSKLPIKYVPLTDSGLPFPDEMFDRVVCFDALHHVPDQMQAIAEFGRVLKQGGIAALHEPGPDHSRSPQSQFEMRNHGVIEADVHAKTLISKAESSGFSRARMALFTISPMFLSLKEFDEFLADSSEQSSGNRGLASMVQDSFRTRRVIFLEKGDPGACLDSRARGGLCARFSLASEYGTHGVRLFGEVKNTGSAAWLPSGSGLGEVNFGVHLVGGDGEAFALDYARRPLSHHLIRAGELVAIDVVVPYPKEIDGGQFVIDLVAEGISWFELNGSETVKIPVPGPAGRQQDLEVESD